PVAPSEDGEPAVTPNPFAAAGGAGASGGDGEPATTSAPGGGTILTDAASLAAERDEYLADLQRLKAEFDNYRKRVARQQEEQSDRAAGALVGKLLPVLDNLDLAYTHLASAHLAPGPAGPPGGADGPDAPVSEEARALLQAREQLLDALAKEGLARVDEVGVEFDPVVHDAVASVQSDGPDEAGASGSGMAVDEVMRAGYRWRSQVLRPAMVRVRS
ncbi:MAG TPA: nucleotide exchange factor GrpE, partial [Acidimicrobiales bacterium]